MSGQFRGEEARRIWRDRLHRHQLSGQSVTEFCAEEGVSAASLYQWRKRLRDSPPNAAMIPQPTFRPVQVVGEAMVTVEFAEIGIMKVPAAQLDAIRVVVAELAEVSRGQISC